MPPSKGSLTMRSGSQAALICIKAEIRTGLLHDPEARFDLDQCCADRADLIVAKAHKEEIP